MSAEYLRVIPRDPDFVPDRAAQEEALRLLATLLPEAGEMWLHVSEEIGFFDQGEGFASVSCPDCGAALDGDEWSRAMNAAYETKFRNRRIVPPCCGRERDLNDLVYDWPAGFGRFALEVREPGITVDLGSEEIARLEAILGCALKQTWAHY